MPSNVIPQRVSVQLANRVHNWPRYALIVKTGLKIDA